MKKCIGNNTQQWESDAIFKGKCMPDMRDDMEVCAKCVAGMPCSLTSPVAPFMED